jgi:hypothetical protein
MYYYNENYLLIASMNTLEYSEKNKMEMGVLLSGDLKTAK